MSLRALFSTQLTDSHDVARDVLGAIQEGGGGERYKYVAFVTGSTAVAAGDVVKYATPAAYIANQVAMSATVALINAGVALSANAASSTTYGWIQISGPVTLAANPTGTLAIGNDLISGALASSHGVFDVTTGVTTDAPFHIYGVLLDITSGSVVALIDCPV